MNVLNLDDSILITGGTGSLGRALAKRILGLNICSRLCIYSRGEHRQAEMAHRFADDRLRFFIGDVRDKDRLNRAASSCSVVIHAAALKRIEAGAYNPDEMVKTNILGSMNVIEAARDCKVKKAILVSSDKAFHPVSPYGYSKAMAESLFHAANGYHGTRYAIVRYGNVAGSAGSVIPAWRGPGPCWMSDPDVTRFWMSLDDAVDLVIFATCEMQGGEIFVPTLPAYRLGALAQAMGVEPRVTGLAKYEKKHECMGEGNCSNAAVRLSVDELKELLKNV